MGCMMNFRMAQALQAMPLVCSIGAALGSKEAAAELRTALIGDALSQNASSPRAILDQLKMEFSR